MSVEPFGGGLDPRVIVLVLGFGGRDRVGRLPQPDRPHAGVGSQKVAESRRPGSGQADDDERSLDLLVGDLRVVSHRGLHPKAVGEQHLEARPQDVAADLVEVGLLVEGEDQAVESLAPAGGPEVGQLRPVRG